MTNRVVERTVEKKECISLHLTLPEELKRLRETDGVPNLGDSDEELEVDYLFTATGYFRNIHESILASTKDLLLPREESLDGPVFPVSRDYRIEFDEDKVDNGAGIWLQGCNEGTHGVSVYLSP
jgi:L-ornithine N5-oxygenase